MPFGTPSKKTHDDYRQFLCLFCLKKADQSLPKYNRSKPNDKSETIKLIEEKLIPNFLEYSSILPGGCCGNCRSIVSDHLKNKSAAKLQLPKSKWEYEQMITVLKSLPPATRNKPNCRCFICTTMQTPKKQQAKGQTKGEQKMQFNIG